MSAPNETKLTCSRRCPRAILDGTVLVYVCSASREYWACEQVPDALRAVMRRRLIFGHQPWRSEKPGARAVGGPIFV